MKSFCNIFSRKHRDSELIEILEQRIYDTTPEKTYKLTKILTILRIFLITYQLLRYGCERHHYIGFLLNFQKAIDNIFPLQNCGRQPLLLDQFFINTFDNFNKLNQISLTPLKIVSDSFGIRLEYNNDSFTSGIPFSIDFTSITDKSQIIKIKSEITQRFERYRRLCASMNFILRYVQIKRFPPDLICLSVDLKIFFLVNKFRFTKLLLFKRVNCSHHFKDDQIQNEHRYYNLNFILVIIISILSILITFFFLIKNYSFLASLSEMLNKYTILPLNLCEILWILEIRRLVDISSGIAMLVSFYLVQTLDQYNQNSSDICSIMLAVTTFLNWILLLGIVSSQKNYNIMIETLKISIPNVSRYLVCVGIIFVSFMILGLTILGPYHKIYSNTENIALLLFCAFNGDSIYSIFQLLSDINIIFFIIGQLYLYSSIIFLSYFALSTMILIFESSFNVAKSKSIMCPHSIINKLQLLKISHDEF